MVSWRNRSGEARQWKLAIVTLVAIAIALVLLHRTWPRPHRTKARGRGRDKEWLRTLSIRGSAAHEVSNAVVLARNYTANRAALQARINNLLLRQASSCPAGHLHLLADTDGIPVLRFVPQRNTRGGGGTLIVAGEHRREHVSTELALALLEWLCAAHYVGGPVTVVPRLNLCAAVPRVPCARKNCNDVDLNRNYPHLFERGSAERVAEDYRGPRALSEVESKLVYALLTASHPQSRLRPRRYLSLHSGEYACYLPWDSRSEPNRDLLAREAPRLDCLRATCPACAVGSAGALSGYLAFGTAADTAYALVGVKHVYTLELYGVDTGTADDRDCFRAFNPPEGEALARLLEMWRRVFSRCFHLPGLPQ